MAQSRLGRATEALVRAVAKHGPWTRTRSLDEGPNWMPDPLRPQPPPSITAFRRRAGTPVAALAAVLLLAAPVLVIHSAVGSSYSLFSSSAASLTASSATPACDPGWYWQWDSDGLAGSCCQLDSSDSNLAENSVLGSSETSGAFADPTSSATPPPTPSGSATPTPDPTGNPQPSPSAPATPATSPSDPSTPTPSPSASSS